MKTALFFVAATHRRTAAFDGSIPNVQDIAMLMDTYHSDPFWAEFGSRCLNCTACAAVCPTCMCFDIKDILSPDAKTGEARARMGQLQQPSFRSRCRRP